MSNKIKLKPLSSASMQYIETKRTIEALGRIRQKKVDELNRISDTIHELEMKCMNLSGQIPPCEASEVERQAKHA